MCVIDWWISYIRAVYNVCGAPFQISGNVSGIRPFHTFRINCPVKTFNRWLPSNVFAGWSPFICVAGTWLSPWSDIILVWYHYIVLCALVTIFNWWLSSKDMNLRVLIKEALVVFHWPVSYYTVLFTWSRYRVIFDGRDNWKSIIYIYICIYIYIYIYI